MERSGIPPIEAGGHGPLAQETEQYQDGGEKSQFGDLGHLSILGLTGATVQATLLSPVKPPGRAL